MCYQLFLASDSPLPQVEWSPGAVLGVAEVAGRPPLPAEINGPYLYDVGAHTHCACGFDRSGGGIGYGPDYDYDGLTVESLTALSDYLTRAVKPGSTALLYYVWTGEETQPVVQRSTISPHQLCDPEFILENRRLIKLYGSDEENKPC